MKRIFIFLTFIPLLLAACAGAVSEEPVEAVGGASTVTVFSSPT